MCVVAGEGCEAASQRSSATTLSPQVKDRDYVGRCRQAGRRRRTLDKGGVVDGGKSPKLLSCLAAKLLNWQGNPACQARV